jgi:hypothetical protein
VPHARNIVSAQPIERPNHARPGAIRASTIVAGTLIGCFVVLIGVSAISGSAENTELMTDTVTVLPSAGTNPQVTLQADSTPSRAPSSSTPTRSSQPRVTVTKTIPLPYDLPPGFGWFKPYDGIAVRLMEISEFECREGQRKCFGIEVFSGAGCPGGATVTMTMHAATNDAEVGHSSQTTSAIPAGGIAAAIVGYDPRGVSVTGELTGISC